MQRAIFSSSVGGAGSAGASGAGAGAAGGAGASCGSREAKTRPDVGDATPNARAAQRTLTVDAGALGARRRVDAFVFQCLSILLITTGPSIGVLDFSDGRILVSGRPLFAVGGERSKGRSRTRRRRNDRNRRKLHNLSRGNLGRYR